ncbi:MAG: MBL fold metallo-hydrolase [Marinoscillum sp.]
MALFKSRLFKGLAIFLSIIFLFILSIMAFVNLAPQFGEVPSGSHLELISQSTNYSKKEFINQIETKMDNSPSNFWGMIKEYSAAKNTAPSKPITTKLDEQKRINDSSAVFTWYGHSTILMELEGKKIFFDPMLGPAASPVSFFANRFKNTPPLDLQSLGEIDVVIFSHDHYDHLDYPTIKAIKDKVGHFYTPLGLGAHLKAWGVPATNITELDWWEEAEFGSFTFTATPARHFSGRGFSRNKTQWASWVVKGTELQIYFSGDSGYGPHFKEIGEKFGAFDFAMMECGQYNERWEAIHMMPEQTVQASLDINAKKMMPIHWAAFTLAPHEWYQPAERVSKAALENNMTLITPEVGETFVLGPDMPATKWWQQYKP